MSTQNSKLKVFFGLLAAIFLPVFINSSVEAVDSLGTVTTYYTGWDYRNPSDIVQAPNGDIWFTRDVEATNGIVRYVPSTSTFTGWNTYNPALSLTNGPDGNIWYAANYKVGKTNGSSSPTEYVLPGNPVSCDSMHDCFNARAIRTGPDGRLWVLAQSTNNGSLRMYMISTSGSLYKAYSLNSAPASPSNYEPLGSMAVDSENGKVWYIYRNHATSRSKIGYVDIQGNSQEYTLPTSIADNVSAVTLGSDGNLWYSGGPYYGYISPSGTLSSLTSTSSMGLGNGAARLATGMDGRLWGSHTMDIALAGITLSDITNPYIYNGFSGAGMYYTGSMPIGMSAGNDGNMWFTLYANYQIGKIGTGVSGSSTDEDGDGLTLDKETKQGTSDKKADTDEDGIPDYYESEWYIDRTSIFCGVAACAYPHPTQKDIYLEVDWMDDGTTYMKPSQNQIDLVKAAFTNKGINLTIDTGEFGGGNEVDNKNPLKFGNDPADMDFDEYKDGTDTTLPNFDSNRYMIWHYAISGYSYAEDTASSGISEVGGDDLFISYGKIKSDAGIFFTDENIAGTLIHELGHNLCLTSAAYNSSRSEFGCAFNGVDNSSATYLDYESSMNYHYQFQAVDYSQGTNGFLSDNDDWASIVLNDFNGGWGSSAGAKLGKNKALTTKAKASQRKAFQKSLQRIAVKSAPILSTEEFKKVKGVKYE